MFAMIQNDLITHLLRVYVFLSSRMLEERVYHTSLVPGAPLHNSYAKGRLNPREAQEGGKKGWMDGSSPTHPLAQHNGFCGSSGNSKSMDC